MTRDGRRLAARRFLPEDQTRFAETSGDFNPLHLDPLVARRTLVGSPAVHGVHNALWALECFLAQQAGGANGAFRPGRIAATFTQPVIVGEEVVARVVREGDDKVEIRVAVGSVDCLKLSLSAGPPQEPVNGLGAAPKRPSRTPVARTIDDLDGLSDRFAIAVDAAAAAADFPHCCAALGAGRVAGLMVLSRLVGMECPGLHSLFSEFAVDIVAATGEDGLSYRVDGVDRRFSLVDMTVAADGVRGRVKAFVRPPPMEQRDMAAIAGLVSPDEFAGQRALVVGGSRGLGEATAKVIACGGGHPVVTFRSGRADAEAVRAAIRASDGACDIAELDVAAPDAALSRLAGSGWQPTHLYYFATPKIFLRKDGFYEPALFSQFCDVFVDGFYRTFRACRRLSPDALKVYYPSTEALDEKVRDLTEYAAAKAAGEALCRQIDRFERGVDVLIDRLPRIATDQTATVMDVPAADAVEVMVAAIRRLAAL